MMAHDATSPYWQRAVALASTVGMLVWDLGLSRMFEAITVVCRSVAFPGVFSVAQFAHDARPGLDFGQAL